MRRKENSESLAEHAEWYEASGKWRVARAYWLYAISAMPEQLSAAGERRVRMLCERLGEAEIQARRLPC